MTLAELAQLAADLRELGQRPEAAWSTHPHWDHVLWSRELGSAPRYATPAAAAVAETERAELAREAQRSAPGHDFALLGRLTPLDAAAVPWDGPEARLIVHDGHAPGHGAVFLPGTGVLVAGDMCSDVEIPLLDLAAPDPLGGYRAGLERLAARARRAPRRAGARARRGRRRVPQPSFGRRRVPGRAGAGEAVR